MVNNYFYEILCLLYTGLNFNSKNDFQNSAIGSMLFLKDFVRWISKLQWQISLIFMLYFFIVKSGKMSKFPHSTCSHISAMDSCDGHAGNYTIIAHYELRDAHAVAFYINRHQAHVRRLDVQHQREVPLEWHVKLPGVQIRGTFQMSTGKRTGKLC